jgi:glc operon protein GlcG
MKTYLRMTIVLGVLFATFASRNAHAQLPNGYGTGIPVETARKVAAAAIAEAKKNGWNVAAAIVDTGGDLVFFERMDNAQVASAIVSQEKARTAVRFKRPSKAFEDALVGGRQAILSLPGVTPLEGGVPLVIEGKIVGAIGVSGATSPQDGQCALAAAETLGKQPTLPTPPKPPPAATPPAATPPKK